jgi:hypothetical protein
MAEWRHPYENLLRMPLSAKEQLRGERMCAAAGRGYHLTSVLRPWRRRLESGSSHRKAPRVKIPLQSHLK